MAKDISEGVEYQDRYVECWNSNMKVKGEDVMERRMIDILCVKEARWKGNGTREVGNRLKLD